MTDTLHSVLESVFQTIKDRQANPKPGSYTNTLFTAGIDEITKKVGEEAIEVIIAAQHQTSERLISELADLTYHSLVLIAQMGLTPDDVAAELQRRHAPRE
jgi:phosphoribosyl-ATP pyrophosphohydrolase